MTVESGTYLPAAAGAVPMGKGRSLHDLFSSEVCPQCCGASGFCFVEVECFCSFRGFLSLLQTVYMYGEQVAFCSRIDSGKK